MTATTRQRHQSRAASALQTPAGHAARSRQATSKKALRALGFSAGEALLSPDGQAPGDLPDATGPSGQTAPTDVTAPAAPTGQVAPTEEAASALASGKAVNQGADGAGAPGPVSKEQVDLLLQKAQLTADEIQLCREYAATLPDGEERQQLYLQLQRRAPYASQRNNQILGQASTGGGLDGQRDKGAIGDVMCNVTALAMDLQSLGVGKSRLIAALPDPKANADFEAFFDTQVESYHASHEPEITKWQYEDLIELARRWYFPSLARTGLAVLGALARLVGVEMSAHVSTLDVRSPAYWKLLQQDAVLQGKTVYLGVHGVGPHKRYTFGHIVRMQEVTEQGVVVDDPYSGFHVMQNASGEAEVTTMDYNGTTSESGGGENHTFTWSDLDTSLINWVRVLSVMPQREPEAGAPGAGGGGQGGDGVADEPLGAPISRMVVVNSDARKREGPPTFAETGRRLALGAQVDVYKQEGTYVLVKDRNEAKLAWTAIGNLTPLARGDGQQTYEADVRQRMGLDQETGGTQETPGAE